ncbi:ABC transporter, putative [Cordyceps militaris CM01]|uniref:ABC transporter, putative n=1 Tax=Cordyceps militaris (strain CM01) TaxID=983644 RepID=G3JRI4_CORMM|nr:ABC transporter, putative [Cordyceps militaris CM01]EGX88587.1 ABC transporter, putative [Cordyceps militaris CM01]
MDTFLAPFEHAVLNHVYHALRVGIDNGPCHHLGQNSSATRPGLAMAFVQEACLSLGHSPFWQSDSIARQFTSAFLYLLTATTFSYLFFGIVFYQLNFDVASARDHKFKPGQIRGEISQSLLAILFMSFLTAPIVLAQAHGYSKIYPFGKAPMWYEGLQMILFVGFNDTCVYWLHRLFHVPVLFRWIHKKHHQYVDTACTEIHSANVNRYITPTPFSAFAFDPLEAMIMSLPIYSFSFLMPMSNVMQLFVFSAAYIWTFLLHDDRTQFHTVHHKNTNYNFGQYTTLWDHWAGTSVDADAFLAQAQYQHKEKS